VVQSKPGLNSNRTLKGYKILKSNEAKRKLFFGLIFATVLFFHFSILRQLRDEGLLPLNDFIEYWSAVRVFTGGGNPYASEDLLKIQRDLGWKESRPLMMWNPPWTLPLLLPLSHLSYWTGRALWHLLSLVIVFCSANWFWLRYGGTKSYCWLSWLAALCFFPVFVSLYLGQISPLILAGITGFIWALDKKRPALAGLSLVLISVKPHVIYLLWLFLLFWVIRKSAWRIMSSAVIALSALSLAACVINPSVFADFYQSISSHSGPMIWPTPTWGMVLYMTIPGAGHWIRYIPSFLGLIVASMLWLKWKSNFQWDRYLPTIMLLSVTSSIFTWTFDWVILLPIIMVILVWFQDSPLQRWWLLAALMAIFSIAVIQLFNYIFTIWLPPALWLVYWAGGKSTPGTRSTAFIEDDL
jgi:hypothetical protein